MSEELLKELRELEVGTFEVEDLAEVGVFAADMTLSASEMAINCSSSCSTSCTSSTCSTCSTTSSC